MECFGENVLCWSSRTVGHVRTDFLYLLLLISAYFIYWLLCLFDEEWYNRWLCLVGSTWITLMQSIVLMSPVKTGCLVSVMTVESCVLLWHCGMEKITFWRKDFLDFLVLKWACVMLFYLLNYLRKAKEKLAHFLLRDDVVQYFKRHWFDLLRLCIWFQIVSHLVCNESMLYREIMVKMWKSCTSIVTQRQLTPTCELNTSTHSQNFHTRCWRLRTLDVVCWIQSLNCWTQVDKCAWVCEYYAGTCDSCVWSYGRNPAALLYTLTIVAYIHCHAVAIVECFVE